MTLITVNLKGHIANISVSLPAAVTLLMMIWAWTGDLKFILRVKSEVSQLGAVINWAGAEAWTHFFFFLWALVLVSWPILRNTFNYKSRCLKKCIPLRNVWIMTHEGGSTLWMVVSLGQSCSNQTVGKKNPLYQLFPVNCCFLSLMTLNLQP